MDKLLRFRQPNVGTVVVALLLGSMGAWGQGRESDSSARPEPLAQSIQELQAQIKELRSAVVELRSEAAQYREETAALRERLESLRASPEGFLIGGSSRETGQSQILTPSSPDQGGQHTAPTIEEQVDLLNGKMDEQYQTKVESASKYRVRLSGMVLLNLFSNRGSVENADIPHLAVPASPDQTYGSFGGTLRQSMVGLEVFGPQWAGAKTSADIQFDFAGGFSQVPNGVTSGLVRLRTARLRMNWANTSVVAGQDALFFAPLSPTSLASLAVPALSYTGNLWSWAPQVRVEHQFKVSDSSNLSLQGGILDPLTGEIPGQSIYGAPPSAPNAYRGVGAGEASRQPGLAGRVAWSTRAFGEPLTLGAGGYYSRENWGYGRSVDGWAGTADVTVPLGHLVSFSGEFYRGKAVGGLGGGIGRSVALNANNLTGPLRPLNALGGWSQVKFKPLSRLEFNVAMGQDDVLAEDAAALPANSFYGQLNRNRGGFVNFIYHPRSNVLFSLEYRRLRTSAIDWADNSANHINLMMGILF